MKMHFIRSSVLLFMLTACNILKAGEPAVIQGTWERETRRISLFQMKDGVLTELSSANLSSGKSFTLACSPDESGSFYYLGESIENPINRYTFYLKAGDKLQIAVNDSSYTLVGKDNSPENKEMTKWHDYIFPLEWKSFYFTKVLSTYEDFFPMVTKMYANLPSYPKAKTPNKAFNRAFETYRKYNFMQIAVEHLLKPRIKQPQATDYIDFYKKLSIADYTTDATMYNYPDCGLLLEHLLYVNALINHRPVSLNEYYANLNLIPNDTLKGELVLHLCRAVRSYAEIEEKEANYGKYFLTNSQKMRFLTLKNKLTSAEVNRPAPNFVVEDIDGKPVSLKDFKGKVVYIDFWATWCGPCIKEIPSLKKLEEEYHGKDIVFMSISIDSPKDHQKWKDFVKKEQMTGLQLYANKEAKKIINDSYHVETIPRFIVISKNGTIVAGDAPRPSMPEIKTLLNKELR